MRGICLEQQQQHQNESSKARSKPKNCILIPPEEHLVANSNKMMENRKMALSAKTVRPQERGRDTMLGLSDEWQNHE